MSKPKLDSEKKQEREALEAVEELTQTLSELGLTHSDASGILRQVVERSNQQKQMANRVLDAIESIGDPAFTLQSLQANKKAMEELESGASIGEIYKKHYVKAKAPRVEKDANLGAGAGRGVELTREDIERISQYVDRTGKVYDL